MTSDDRAIRDLVALWHSATGAGDVDTVLGLMAGDVVFLVAGHPPMRGRSSFEIGLRKLLATHRIESTGENGPAGGRRGAHSRRERLVHPSQGSRRFVGRGA